MPNTPDIGFQFGVEGDQALLSTIQRLRQEMGTLKTQHDSLASSAVTLQSVWQGLISVAAGFQLLQHIREAGDFNIQMRNLSLGTGVAADKLAGLHDAVAEMGGDWDRVSVGLKKMLASQQDAVDGNQKAIKGFQDLGISVKDLKKLTPEELLYRVADGFLKTGSSAAKAQAARAIFGRGGQELIAMFLLLGPAMREHIAEMAKLSGVTEQTTDASEHWKLSTEQLEVSARRLSGVFLPFLTDMSEGLSDVVNWAKLLGKVISLDLVAGFHEAEAEASADFEAIKRAATGDFAGAKTAFQSGINASEAIRSLAEHKMKMAWNEEEKSRAKVIEAAIGKLSPHVKSPGNDLPDGGPEKAARGDKLAAERQQAADELALDRILAQGREQADKDSYERALISLNEYFDRRRADIQSAADEEARVRATERGALSAGLAGAKPEEVARIKQEIAHMDAQSAQAAAKLNNDLAANEMERFKAAEEHAKKELEDQKRLAEVERQRQRQAGEAVQEKFTGEGGTGGLSEKKSNLQEQVSAGELQPYQAAQQLRAEYERTIPVLQRQVDLLHQMAAAADDAAVADELTKKADEDEKAIARLRAEAAKMDITWMSWRTEAISSIDQVSTHLTTGLNGWIQGHQRFGQALAQTWNSIVMTAVTSLEKIAGQWIAQHLKMLLIKQTTNQAGVASDAATAAQGAAISQAASLKQRLIDAKDAARGAFKSVMHLPFPLNIILAPVVAAAAFAGAMAFARGGAVNARSAPRLVAFSSGGRAARSMLGGGAIFGAGTSTSDSIPAMLSNGEYVVNAAATRKIGLSNLEAMNRGAFLPAIHQPAPYSADGFRRYAGGSPIIAGGGGGGGHTTFNNEFNLHHNGPDAREILETEMVPMITKAIRRGNLR